jgi:hypothetical protein
MRRILLAAVALGMAAWPLAGATQAEDSKGDYIHSFTGFTFPPTVSAFTRRAITPYYDQKSDIEVDYDNSPFTIHGSVYAYPADEHLKAHFQDCEASVLQLHPTATLVHEGTIIFDRGGTQYHGYTASYTFREKFGSEEASRALLSKLIVFRRNDYYVLFRITYLKSDSPAPGQIDDFFQKFP